MKVILFSRGDCIMLYSFFLNQGFVPLDFPGKVFNETTLIIIVYSFSFTEFLSQWVFLSKVLMRYNNICYGHTRGVLWILWLYGCPYLYKLLAFPFLNNLSNEVSLRVVIVIIQGLQYWHFMRIEFDIYFLVT